MSKSVYVTESVKRDQSLLKALVAIMDIDGNYIDADIANAMFKYFDNLLGKSLLELNIIKHNEFGYYLDVLAADAVLTEAYSNLPKTKGA